MKDRIKLLLKNYAPRINAEKVSELIFKRYSEHHRYYHNLNHIEYCLKEYDNYVLQNEYKQEIELAIWFHDLIYAPRAKDNEEKSAEEWLTVTENIRDKNGLIEDVYNLILITKHNKKPQNLEEKIIIDIDLSILGAEEAVYNSYSSSIRKEYEFIELNEYRKARRNVLDVFLQRDFIFYTDYFKNKYEANAICNIKNEIKLW